jgi:hypothetical protein
MMLCQNSGSELDNDPFALFRHEIVSANNAINAGNANNVGSREGGNVVGIAGVDGIVGIVILARGYRLPHSSKS